MFIRKPKAKQFEYTPRYYKPEEDLEERKKRRLGFRASRNAKRRGRNPLIWLLFIVVVVYIYLRFSGYL